jgi:hypothetical protein
MLDEAGPMQKQRLALLAALALTACPANPSTDEELIRALGQRSAPTPKAAAARAKKPPPLQQGFGLLVLPGQGAGPIRIGARSAHIERLMQARCELRSENLCRYAARGLDFHLVGGELQQIHVQRAERPAGKDAAGNELEFGFFNGIIAPDLRLGMTPQAIQEHLGKPYRSEKVAEPNPQNMVWRHYYPGMILEYDRWQETGKLILGGIVIYKDPNFPLGVPDAGATDAGTPSDAGVAPARDAGAKLPVRDAGVRVRQPEPR